MVIGAGLGLIAPLVGMALNQEIYQKLRAASLDEIVIGATLSMSIMAASLSITGYINQTVFIPVQKYLNEKFYEWGEKD